MIQTEDAPEPIGRQKTDVVLCTILNPKKRLVLNQEYWDKTGATTLWFYATVHQLSSSLDSSVQTDTRNTRSEDFEEI